MPKSSLSTSHHPEGKNNNWVNYAYYENSKKTFWVLHFHYMLLLYFVLFICIIYLFYFILFYLNILSYYFIILFYFILIFCFISLFYYIIFPIKNKNMNMEEAIAKYLKRWNIIWKELNWTELNWRKSDYHVWIWQSKIWIIIGFYIIFHAYFYGIINI